MSQYGFFIDLSRCIGCNSCAVSCAQWHDIQPGPVKWLRVHQWETGNFPDVRLHMLPVPCFHCEHPVCARACPNGAITKEDSYGAVVVNPDLCKGTRKCWKACPYGAPQFDERTRKMSKCNMCLDRLQTGLKPICVLSCSMRALEFGPLDELASKYGGLRSIEGLPAPSVTGPAVIFRSAAPRKNILPWKSDRALDLWQKRDSPPSQDLPDLFRDKSDVTDAPSGIRGRHRLILKPRTREERYNCTTDDE